MLQFISSPYKAQKMRKREANYYAQKVKFSIKDFFNKCDQIVVSCGFGHIY